MNKLKSIIIGLGLIALLWVYMMLIILFIFYTQGSGYTESHFSEYFVLISLFIFGLILLLLLKKNIINLISFGMGFLATSIVFIGNLITLFE